MKTFTDYINEKQNFIFGGKEGLTGKEYEEPKSLDIEKKQLSWFKEGEEVYCYKVYLNNDKIDERIYRVDNINTRDNSVILVLEKGEKSKYYKIATKLQVDLDSEYLRPTPWKGVLKNIFNTDQLYIIACYVDYKKYKYSPFKHHEMFINVISPNKITLQSAYSSLLSRIIQEYADDYKSFFHK